MMFIKFTIRFTSNTINTIQYYSIFLKFDESNLLDYWCFIKFIKQITFNESIASSFDFGSEYLDSD